MTLLMSTEELLAVLADGGAKAPSSPPPTSERRLRIVPPPDADAPPEPAPPLPPGIGARPANGRALWTPPAAPVARRGLRRRLQCARLGHDPRPHRPLPHDEVVYRCLRCGRATPAPQRP